MGCNGINFVMNFHISPRNFRIWRLPCLSRSHTSWYLPISGGFTFLWLLFVGCCHYDDVIMSAIASQITSLTIVYSTVYPGADQSKHQSSASLAFVWGIHRRPVNSPHKWPVTRKMFPFDDVIMQKTHLKHKMGWVHQLIQWTLIITQYQSIFHHFIHVRLPRGNHPYIKKIFNKCIH